MDRELRVRGRLVLVAEEETGAAGVAGSYLSGGLVAGLAAGSEAVFERVAPDPDRARALKPLP